MTEAYMQAIADFVQDNGIPRDLPSRIRKAGEELGEVSEAIAHHFRNPTDGTNARVCCEVADLIMVGFHMLMILHPLRTAEEHTTFMTEVVLQASEKYRKGRNRTEERP